jgi:hypothetical protein
MDVEADVVVDVSDVEVDVSDVEEGWRWGVRRPWLHRCVVCETRMKLAQAVTGN